MTVYDLIVGIEILWCLDLCLKCMDKERVFKADYKEKERSHRSQHINYILNSTDKYIWGNTII